MLSPTSRVFSKKSPSRLGTYLATAVGSCGLAPSAEAAIVSIDVSARSGLHRLGRTNSLKTKLGKRHLLARYAFNAAALLVSFALVGNASAEVILDTTSSTSPGGNGVSGGTWIATLFTTGSTGATVRSIGLPWTSVSTPLDTDSGRNTTMRLDTNSGGLPGVLQGTLSTIYEDTNAKILYVTDETGVTLNANTDYWFVAAPTAGSQNFTYPYANTLTYTGGIPGYSVPTTGGSAFSTNQGGSFSSFTRGPLLVQMRTDVVSAVPEPSTGALAALVLGGTALGVARRRRKQQAAATTEQAV